MKPQTELCASYKTTVAPSYHSASRACTTGSFTVCTLQISLLNVDLVQSNHTLNFLPPGKQINYNIQVAPHQDSKNSNLLDSVFFYGRNFTGGRLVLSSLGVSLSAQPGYSIHARFKFLEHAVSPILTGADPHAPPLRISLALYSRADVYASAARVSAARKGPAHFSDWSMWLPFPPPNFSITTCCKILRGEEEHWKEKARVYYRQNPVSSNINNGI